MTPSQFRLDCARRHFRKAKGSPAPTTPRQSRDKPCSAVRRRSQPCRKFPDDGYRASIAATSVNVPSANRGLVKSRARHFHRRAGPARPAASGPIVQPRASLADLTQEGRSCLEPRCDCSMPRPPLTSTRFRQVQRDSGLACPRHAPADTKTMSRPEQHRPQTRASGRCINFDVISAERDLDSMPLLGQLHDGSLDQ